MIDRPKSLGVLALATALIVGACSSAATSPNPSTGGASGESAAASNAPQPSTSQVTLQAAGATFPAPLYGVWIEKYNAKYPNIQINYQSIGSGGGIKAITDETVDFGASDAPMKDEEIAALKNGEKVLHVPTALGAVVIIYNLPGVSELKLDATNIADLFLGNITTWNDPKIAANNPGVTLPSTAVLVVHRSDGSGTTNAFTTYLDTVSPDWHSKVGKGKDVKWPTGIGGKGNDGVAGAVKQTPGALGYVELNYATQAQLASSKIKNADGNFVAGSTAGVTAAANAIADNFPADFRQGPIINGAGAETYPIASYTYLLVPQTFTDVEKAKTVVSFIYWALTDGQAEEDALGYAALPKSVDDKAIALLHSIAVGGSPVWP